MNSSMTRAISVASSSLNHSAAGATTNSTMERPPSSSSEVRAYAPKLSVDRHVRPAGEDEVVDARHRAVEVELDGHNGHTVQMAQAVKGSAVSQGRGRVFQRLWTGMADT